MQSDSTVMHVTFPLNAFNTEAAAKGETQHCSKAVPRLHFYHLRT